MSASSEPNADLTPLDLPRGGLPEVTNADIANAVAQLRAGTGAFAVDTERAMGIRYSNRAYLVQVRRPGAGTFLIDPIGIEDKLTELREVMQAEWILHAADQDLPCLHELGLYPEKVFDTELAGLILGFEHVSLQAMVADLLGWELAKEHSTADWSQRPLGPELRAYAALDVELLHELKEVLVAKLIAAGRLEWLEQECEAVRLSKPAPPPKQPWRRAARQAGIRDTRALAMVRELWRVRDELAQQRDLAPGRVLPNKVLAELAARKPRSRADVARSSLLRSRERRQDANNWWRAIDIAWRLDERALPARRFQESTALFPPVNRWERHDEDAAARWAALRTAIFGLADELGIRQDILLKPAIQRHVAWFGWSSRADLAEKLAEQGARPWQIEQVSGVLDSAVRASK
ncbi:MAG: HRDC domain-containing protein [Trueperella sp.]|nr:HRDC domain-containing protein [Trueperella sp.]